MSGLLKPLLKTARTATRILERAIEARRG